MQVNPSSPRLRLPLVTAKSRLSPSARPKLGGSQQEREDLRRRLARDPTSRDAFAFRPAAAFPSMALDAEIFADMFDEVDRSTCVAGAVCVLNAVALVNAAVATNVVAVNAVEIAVVADNAVAVTSTVSGRAIESGHQMPLYLPAREQAV